MRGSGVEPLSRSGRQPSVSPHRKPKFPGGMPRIPRWKRHIRSTPRDRASEKGSRGDAPCFGNRGRVSPCAWMSRQPGVPFQPCKFPSRRRRPPALETSPLHHPHRSNHSATQALRGVGGETSSDLASLGHLPLRGRLIRPKRNDEKQWFRRKPVLCVRTKLLPR